MQQDNRSSVIQKANNQSEKRFLKWVPGKYVDTQLSRGFERQTSDLAALYASYGYDLYQVTGASKRTSTICFVAVTGPFPRGMSLPGLQLGPGITN